MVSALPLVVDLLVGVVLAMAICHALDRYRRRARLRAIEERMDALLQRLGALDAPPQVHDVLAEWRRLRQRDEP